MQASACSRQPIRIRNDGYEYSTLHACELSNFVGTRANHDDLLGTYLVVYFTNMLLLNCDLMPFHCGLPTVGLPSS